VRFARENAALNRCSAVKFQRADIHTWQPRRRYRIAMANLFSGILIASAPTLASAVEPGGALIASGILRDQWDEVLSAFDAVGLRLELSVARGKWCAVLCRASEAACSPPLLIRGAS